MSLGQRRVGVPTVSGWSCVSREIYKVEQCKIPRYSRVLYHQKGTRTALAWNRWQACYGIRNLEEPFTKELYYKIIFGCSDSPAKRIEVRVLAQEIAEKIR